MIWNVRLGKHSRICYAQLRHAVGQHRSRGVDQLQPLAHLNGLARQREAVGLVVTEIDIGKQDVDGLLGLQERQSLGRICGRPGLVAGIGEDASNARPNEGAVICRAIVTRPCARAPSQEGLACLTSDMPDATAETYGERHG